MKHSYFDRLTETIDQIKEIDVLRVVDSVTYCRGTVYVFGNGGSASTASHFAQDMSKEKGRCFVCLNDSISIMLAYANDFGFQYMFKKQLENKLTSNDVVIGISFSGNSPNVLNAIEYGNQKNAITIGFYGFDGGRLRDICDVGIHVPSSDMQICEDIHLIFTHLIARMI